MVCTRPERPFHGVSLACYPAQKLCTHSAISRGLKCKEIWTDRHAMCYVRQGLISNKTAEKLPQILRPRGHSSDFRASPKWNSIFEKITQRSFRKDHQGSRVCKSNKSIEGQYREQESHWTDATDALEQTSLDRDNIAGPAWNGEDIRHAKICKDEFDVIKMIP